MRTNGPRTAKVSKKVWFSWAGRLRNASRAQQAIAVSDNTQAGFTGHVQRERQRCIFSFGNSWREAFSTGVLLPRQVSPYSLTADGLIPPGCSVLDSRGDVWSVSDSRHTTLRPIAILVFWHLRFGSASLRITSMGLTHV